MPTGTRTYAFTADTEGLADVGDNANLTSQHSTDNGGSLEWVCAAGTNNSERSRDTNNATWESQFGVPPGSLVTTIQCPSFQELFWNDAGYSNKRVRIRFVDASGTIVHSAGELQDVSGAITPLTGAPQSRGAGTARAVDSAYQASSTVVKLEVQVDLTGTATGTADIEQDTIAITVTYADSPAVTTKTINVPLRAT